MNENNNASFIAKMIEDFKDHTPYFKGKDDPYTFLFFMIKNKYFNQLELNDQQNINDINRNLIFNDQYELIANDPINAILKTVDDNNEDVVLFKVNTSSNCTQDEILADIVNMWNTYNNTQKDNLTTKKDSYSNQDVFTVVGTPKYKESSISPNLKTKLALLPEPSENGVVRFVLLYPKTLNTKREINLQALQTKFDELTKNPDKYALNIKLAPDLALEMQNFNRERPYVSFEELGIYSNKVLEFNNNALIVSLSAKSLHNLWWDYKENANQLFGANLRFYIKLKKIDNDIKDSIINHPNQFWYKNNGLTIVCRNYKVVGNKVELTDFSIVNGGQTTYLIGNKFSFDDATPDFYLPCKIIKMQGENEQQQNQFVLEIAKAANEQKPIKEEDLKANSNEQIEFQKALTKYDILYVMKRGPKVKLDKKSLHMYEIVKLIEAGKLMMAGILQLPGYSRNSTAKIFDDKFYDFMFPAHDKNALAKHAHILRDLLYIQYAYDKLLNDENNGFSQSEMVYANNARTIGIAFIALLSRIHNQSINLNDLRSYLSEITDPAKQVTKIFADSTKFSAIFNDVDYKKRDEKIYPGLVKLFTIVIKNGCNVYSINKKLNPQLTESNYLKSNKTYYEWLKSVITSGTSLEQVASQSFFNLK